MLSKSNGSDLSSNVKKSIFPKANRVQENINNNAQKIFTKADIIKSKINNEPQPKPVNEKLQNSFTFSKINPNINRLHPNYRGTLNNQQNKTQDPKLFTSKLNNGYNNVKDKLHNYVGSPVMAGVNYGKNSIKRTQDEYNNLEPALQGASKTIGAGLGLGALYGASSLMSGGE